MVLDGADKAAKNAANILRMFREQEAPIFHIQHESPSPDFGFMIANSEGQKIHESVKPINGEPVVVKNYPNAFWNTPLEDDLKKLNIDNIIIVGMMTHMCVSATARAGMERGFNVTVIPETCATLALDFIGEQIPAETVHKTALAELTLIATISPLETFIQINKNETAT